MKIEIGKIADCGADYDHECEHLHAGRSDELPDRVLDFLKFDHLFVGCLFFVYCISRLRIGESSISDSRKVRA